MKRIALLFIFTRLLSSCEKAPDTTGDDYNLQGNGVIKTKYIYASSDISGIGMGLLQV
ncbi:MAG: hypothetical protein WAW07_03945 [Bacteroidales bacterium]